jgi:hypothetical protein
MDSKQRLKRARDWSVVTLMTFLFANFALFQAHFDRLPNGQLFVGFEFIMIYVATVVMSVFFWFVLEFVFRLEGPITLVRKVMGKTEPLQANQNNDPSAGKP